MKPLAFGLVLGALAAVFSPWTTETTVAADAAASPPPQVAAIERPTASPIAKRGSAAIARPEVGISQARERIEAALKSPTELNVEDESLANVVEWIRDVHKIEVQLDRRSLTDVGVNPESPITINVKGVSLRSALSLMLRQLDLKCAVRDEVLLITTPEEAEECQETRVYPVGDLIVWYRDGADEPYPDYGELMCLIKNTIAPTTWDEVGGKGAMEAAEVSQSLVVSQTAPVHEQIENLFADLREAKKQIDVEHQPPQPRLRKKLRDDEMGGPMMGGGGVSANAK